MSRLLFLLTIGLVVALSASAQTGPAPVPPQNVDSPPYSYNGRIYADGSHGSGSLVAEGVFATAAHLVYEDGWLPASLVRFYPRYHENKDPLASSSPYFIPAGLQRWTSYYPERLAAEEEPELPHPETFNVDFAAGWFNSGVQDPLVLSYAEVNVDLVGEPSIMQNSREKLLVGYPVEAGMIPANQTGLMHEVVAADYLVEWEGVDKFFEYDYEFPGDPLWIGLYNLHGAISYAGNSGGPVYARDDMNNWVMAGVILANKSSDQILIRGMDENTYAWIQEVISNGRQTQQLHRVDDVILSSAKGNTIVLQWSDLSTVEEGYNVFRASAGYWTHIATLEAGATSFSDDSVSPGQVYSYQIQPFATGNRPPKSEPLQVLSDGSFSVAGELLGEPVLHFGNDGFSNWYVDGSSRLRSGITHQSSYSSLSLDLIGPGSLNFQWGVSSESNPNYNAPGDPIYDALYLYLDGQPVMEGDAVVFISGNVPSSERQLNLSAGNHTVEWRYQKNASKDALEDAGFLHSLQWNPHPLDGYPVYGAFATGDGYWLQADWLGLFHSTDPRWIAHGTLGWIRLEAGNPDGRLYARSIHSDLGTFSTSPDLFPYLYHFESGTWLYYYEDTGLWGKSARFWDVNRGSLIQIH